MSKIPEANDPFKSLGGVSNLIRKTADESKQEGPEVPKATKEQPVKSVAKPTVEVPSLPSPKHERKASLKASSKQVGFYLSHALAKAVKVYAAQEDLDQSVLAEQALRDYLRSKGVNVK